jgi:hypothetical protein
MRTSDWLRPVGSNGVPLRDQRPCTSSTSPSHIEIGAVPADSQLRAGAIRDGTAFDEGTVRAAIALASRAPSTHNTQPWICRLGVASVQLYADPTRWLPATDRDRRDLIVSCGAMLHHLQVALGSFGIDVTIHRLPNPADP